MNDLLQQSNKFQFEPGPVNQPAVLRSAEDEFVKLSVTVNSLPSEQVETSHTVRVVEWLGHLKILRFADGIPDLTVSRSTCVSDGDSVIVNGSRAWVSCRNGRTQILPGYVARERIDVGDLQLEFLIKEPTEAEELSAIEGLSSHHYRSKASCGRVARLIVRNFHPIYPQVIGYIELATPLYMSKPRSYLFNAPFEHESVSWKTWDMATTKQFIHAIVRVARCVVYPEFRGMSLGQLMLKHAAAYARTRWQMRGMKPLFLEISADMLRFVPFAQAAGMIYIGDTQGNLVRAAKDMAYLLKNVARVESREIVDPAAFGIVAKQVTRMRHALELMDQQGWSIDELVRRLEGLARNPALDELARFSQVVTLPKPMYMLGLAEASDHYVRERVLALYLEAPGIPAIPSLVPLAGTIRLEGVSVVRSAQLRRTAQTHAIAQAFGIAPESIQHEIIRNLTLVIQPGEIVLLTGPSGAGKSTLLALLERAGDVPTEGVIEWPSNAKPGACRPLDSSAPLIEALAPEANQDSVAAALHLLGVVGLSDAYVYLKRFHELSNGQQYRAMLARLIAGGNNLWLIDEFCANLDVITANVVARRVATLARKLGAALVVASSRPEVFVGALKPDIVVRLTTAADHGIVKGSDFLRTLSLGRSAFGPQVLPLTSELLEAVRGGRKVSTIRKGHLNLTPGLLLLTASGQQELVTVTRVHHTRLHLLTESDAQRDGFVSLDSLLKALHSFYPDLRPRAWVSIVEFIPGLNPISVAGNYE